MKWSTDELANLAADLGAAGAEAGRLADQATRKAGLDAVALAQAGAPVDTGFHRSSIGMDAVAPGVVEFGATSHYAPYLEHGTYKMAPRPHIHPAADAVEPQLQAAISQIPGMVL